MQNWAIANCRKRTCKIKVNMLKFSLLLLLTSEHLYRHVRQWYGNSGMQILQKTWQILLLRFRISPEAMHEGCTQTLHQSRTTNKQFMLLSFPTATNQIFNSKCAHVHWVFVCVCACACTFLWMHVLRKEEITKSFQEWHWRVWHSEDAKYHLWYA